MNFSKGLRIPVFSDLLLAMGLLMLVMVPVELVSAQIDSEADGGFVDSLREKQILLENLKHIKEIKDQMEQIFGDGFDFTTISESVLSNSSLFAGNYKCLEDILIAASLMLQKNTSALKMLDAWGKPSEGLLNMRMAYLGSYDECLATKIPKIKGEIKGKYCSVTISLGGGNSTTAMINGILLGTCFPSSCNKDSIKNMLMKVIPKVDVSTCATDDPLPWKPEEIAALVVISFLALLVVAGTVLDGYVRLIVKNRKTNSPTSRDGKLDGLAFRVLLCFSAYSNSKKIFNVSNTQGTLGVLHGMKFFSMSWVVLCHCYSSFDMKLPVNPMAYIDMLNKLGPEIIINGSVSVDTFFFISGFLVAYVAIPQLMKLREKNQRFNIFAFYFHRYWRLTPPLALAIALSIFWSRLGFGPFWNRDTMTENCRKSWWSNLVYINNFYRSGLTDMCIGQSWYLANDIQFYLISPLFLVLLIRHELLGILVTSLFALESVICTGVITAVNHYPPSTFILPALAKGNNFKSFEDIYVKPYTRIGPYCLGIIAGYIICRYPKLKLNFLTKAAGWLATGAILLAILFIPFEWNKGAAYTDVEAIFFSSLHRIMWSLGIAWIVVMCATGQGGVIDEFLSWNVFVPLSRLSYMVFLVHFNIVYMCYNSTKVPLYFSHFNVILWFIDILVLSYALAYVCALVFEAPFVGIEKIIFRRPSKSPSESSATKDIHPVSVSKWQEAGKNPTQCPEEGMRGKDNPGFVKEVISTEL